jgi:hypothetical protein
VPRSWRRLALFAALLLIAAGFARTFASPPDIVAASPTVRLSPATGKVGDPLTVSFSGFPKSQTITVAWNGKPKATTESSTAGAGSVSFAVPTGRKGAHKVTATSGSVTALATFTMVPKLTLSPGISKVYGALTVTLRGYAKNESISLRWDTSSAKPLATVTADAAGSASARVNVPPATLGRHKLIGLGATRSLGSAWIHVESTVKLRTRSGPPGTNLVAVMRGFAKGETIEIQWRNSLGTKSLATATTSATGSVDKTVTVPDEIPPGRYAIVAVGYDSGVAAEAPFTVT